MCGNAVVMNANRAAVNDGVPPILGTWLSPAGSKASHSGGGMSIMLTEWKQTEELNVSTPKIESLVYASASRCNSPSSR